MISTPIDVEAITVFFGKEIKMEWEQLNKELISRRILITKPELNGKTARQHLRKQWLPTKSLWKPNRFLSPI